MYCRNCGSKLSENGNFCVSCGARADGASAPAAEAEPAAANALPSDPPARAEAEPEVVAAPAPGSGAVIPENLEAVASAPERGGTVAVKSKKRRIGILAGLGAAVIALAALVFMTGAVPSETIDTPDILVYLSGNSLMLMKDYPNGASPIRLTDTASNGSFVFQFSDDWKWIYFLANYDPTTESASLYRAEVARLGADPAKNESLVEKIDFGMSSYGSDFTLLKNGSALYSKVDNSSNTSTLYFFDGSGSRSLGAYHDYMLSDDETRIVFTNADHELCYQLLADKNSCTKIDSEVDFIHYADEQTFLYTKYEEDFEKCDVYRATTDGKSEKLLSGVAGIFNSGSVTAADRFYYVKDVVYREVPLYELINDSYLERDQAMLQTGTSSYEVDRREELRNSLRSKKIEMSEGKLYLFADGKSHLICDSIIYPRTWTDSEQQIVFYNKASQIYKQIDIDEISSAEEVSRWDENHRIMPDTLFYTIGANAEQQIEVPRFVDLEIMPFDQQIMLNFKDNRYFSEGEVISYQIANGILSNRNFLVDDCYGCHWTDSGELYYLLNFKVDSADLYRYSREKGSELVAGNVAVYRGKYLQSDGSIYFMRDPSRDPSAGNMLMMVANGNSTRIANGVEEFSCTKSNQCIYRVGGDLYLHDRDGNKHLAENVTRFWCTGELNTI